MEPYLVCLYVVSLNDAYSKEEFLMQLLFYVCSAIKLTCFYCSTWKYRWTVSNGRTSRQGCRTICVSCIWPITDVIAVSGLSQALSHFYNGNYWSNTIANECSSLGFIVKARTSVLSGSRPITNIDKWLLLYYNQIPMIFCGWILVHVQKYILYFCIFCHVYNMNTTVCI